MLRFMAAAALVGWALPAGAVSLCPDDRTGEYTHEACDLIWPFEPDPDRVECDIVEDTKAGEAHPVCLDYYLKEWRLDEDTIKSWRVPT
jgi:hypothetical protein